MGKTRRLSKVALITENKRPPVAVGTQSQSVFIPTLEQKVPQYQDEKEANKHDKSHQFADALQELENGVRVTPPHPHKDPRPMPTWNSKDEEKEITALPNRGAARKWAYKNVLGVAFSFLLVFSAFFGLQSLQTSINSIDGLGLASLGTLYSFFTLSGFFTPGILKSLGSKYSLLVSFPGYLIFTVANFYPSWYTLIPASVIAGFASGPMWAASAKHLTMVATTVAAKLNKDQEYLIGFYTGIFFCNIAAALVPGNLISSLILFPYNGINESMLADDLEYENSSCKLSATEVMDSKLRYILFSIYAMFIVIGILILVVMVNHIPTNNERFGSRHVFKLYFKDPVVVLLKVMKNYRMFLIAPMSIFNGMELSFINGAFTKVRCCYCMRHVMALVIQVLILHTHTHTQVYVANCFGIYQVGFIIIAFGLTSAVMSFVYGRIVKYVPRLFIFVFGSTINIILLVFLLVWSLAPSYIVIFMFAIGWGIADAVWNTMVTSEFDILRVVVQEA